MINNKLLLDNEWKPGKEWVSNIRLLACILYSVLILFGYFFLQVKVNYYLVFLTLLALFLNSRNLIISSFLFLDKVKELAISLVLDIFIFGVLLYFYGGHTNPFSTMLLLYVFLAAIALNEKWTWILFGLSSIIFSLLYVFYRSVAIFEMQSHAHHAHDGFSIHLYGMLISFLILGALSSYFFSRFNRERKKYQNEILNLRGREFEDQKLLSLATLCAGAGHELGTPLNTMFLITEDLKSSPDIEPYIKQEIIELDKQLIRISNVLKKMKSGLDVEGEPIVVSDIQSIVDSLKIDIDCKCKFEFELEPGLINKRFRTFVDSFKNSLMVLINNAVNSYRDNKPDSPSVKLFVKEKDNFLVWEISDYGEGMSEDVIKRLGEPFFTTREVGKGMGLGLYLVRSFCRIVGGKLEFLSKVGEGTTVRLFIPSNN